MRIACAVEYNGSFYHGWQRQEEGLLTVQGELESALSRVADHPVRVITAGRTDTQVHATQQIIHFDTQSERGLHNWLMGTNSYLPHSIRLVNVWPVTDDFHARFSAHFRRYCYLIHSAAVKTAIFHDQVTMDHRIFDVQRMHLAAQTLVGTHDFSAFRAAACQAKQPVRSVEFANVSRTSQLIKIDIQANGFLHHMVRNIAGVLMSIGAGEQPVEWCEAVLQAKSRCLAGITAPGGGLYFIHTGYPAKYGCPTAPRWPLLALS